MGANVQKVQQNISVTEICLHKESNKAPKTHHIKLYSISLFEKKVISRPRLLVALSYRSQQKGLS